VHICRSQALPPSNRDDIRRGLITARTLSQGCSGAATRMVRRRSDVADPFALAPNGIGRMGIACLQQKMSFSTGANTIFVLGKDGSLVALACPWRHIRNRGLD
jgi:hypothetical protein